VSDRSGRASVKPRPVHRGNVRNAATDRLEGLELLLVKEVEVVGEITFMAVRGDLERPEDGLCGDHPVAVKADRRQADELVANVEGLAHPSAERGVVGTGEQAVSGQSVGWCRRHGSIFDHGARATEVDAAYGAYDDHPIDECDEWGDLASFRAAAAPS
jgi:hypothetical protein